MTEASSPAACLAMLLVAVGWHAASGVAGAVWGAMAAVLTVAAPLLYICHGVRTGRITDRHVHVRQQRRGPLLVGLASIVAGGSLLAWLPAPRELFAVLAAGFVGLAVSVLVSRWWKMSLHTAVAAGAVAILGLVFGPALLALSALLPVIGWSRVALGDHTVAQVVGGGVIGAAVAASIFTLLR